MTKAITILALTCFLVGGAAVTTILARGGVPDAGADVTAAVIESSVVANRESKQDKLTVTRLACLHRAAASRRHQRAAASGLCLR